MSDEPWLWLLAGPNGAGKSTFAESNFTHIEGISPDRSALQLEPTAPERVAFLAGRKARLRMRDLLDGRRSFGSRPLSPGAHITAIFSVPNLKASK